MSGSATNSKCPVCRTEGRYRPQREIEKRLNVKHVKCPIDDCSWAGKLQDYKWHSKRHVESEDEEKVGLPAITSLNGSQSNSTEFPSTGQTSRQRLEQLIDSFQVRLTRRRQEIERHQQEQERQRQESLQEVESLGRRLEDVSSNLMRLINNLHEDSRRYQGYVNEAQSVLPQGSVRENEETTSNDEARVERILASTTPTSNPFIVPNEFRTPPRGTNSEHSSHQPTRSPRQLQNISRPNRLLRRPMEQIRSRIRQLSPRNTENTDS